MVLRACRIKKSPAEFYFDWAKNNPGDDLLSHRVTSAVPSALEDLTSEFGMVSGVAPPLSSPEKKQVH